jgi:hypothetical protein
MQNFGRIKNAYNGLLSTNVGNMDEKSKLLFKKYVKTINESKILKAQFLIYNNIENIIDTDSSSATHFVQENINLLQKYKVSDIISENEKLLNLSPKVTKLLGEDYDLSTLHTSIGNLITTKKNPKNINEVINDMKTVVSHINGNKAVVIKESVDTDMPISMMTNLMSDKYNEKYDQLDETTKSVLRVIMNGTDEEKVTTYNKVIRECIDLINEKLPNSNLETKDNLLKVKDKLLNTTVVMNEAFIADISKILDLKSSLI